MADNYVSVQSYTAANGFPNKLLHHQTALQGLRPVHIQWMPTNRCNLACRVCSCAQRNVRLEMRLDRALDVIGQFARLGTLAVTVTGGGEPLMHAQIGRMLEEFARYGIKIGLVTNGTLLGELTREQLRLLTWCRISSMDDRNFSPKYEELLATVAEVSPIDWAFSHVVTGFDRDLDTLGKIVDFANAHDFTHVRVVGNLLAPEEVDWDKVKRFLKGRDQLVIYQDRTSWVPAQRCWLGYVKPVVWPDFRMYLCCGAQYALDGDVDRDMPTKLCMGSASDLPLIYGGPREAFPVQCNRCYYDDYNRLLAAAQLPLKHQEFI